MERNEHKGTKEEDSLKEGQTTTRKTGHKIIAGDTMKTFLGIFDTI